MTRRVVRVLEELVFWEVFSLQKSLRSELSRHVGASSPTISRAVDSLLEKQLIVQQGAAQVSRGRKPQFLTVNPRLATLLGLEVDRDRVTAVVTNLTGNLLGRGSLACDAAKGVDAVLKASRKAIGDALRDAGLSKSEVSRLGVGHPGVLDVENGRCLFWPNVSGWINVPLRQMVEASIGVHVTLDDRSRALALAERRARPTDGLHRNAIYVNVGTGIGTGIFVEGELFRGSTKTAGEIGHLSIDKNGPFCSCGKRGCVEAYAGISAVMRDIRAALTAGAFSSLRKTCNENWDELSIEMVASAAAKGDRVALTTLHNAASALGMGLADAIQILNPSLIVLCGKLVRLVGSFILPVVKDAVVQQCFAGQPGQLEIRLTSPKKDISAVGCALLGADVEARRIVREKLYEASSRSASFLSN